RVSFFCNFHGPSLAVDTMCSSSLTAIHLACQSLQRGDCEIAIGGGVNVSIHPNKYLTLAQGQFISSQGRCESFGIGGDGYVPAEGVGAVMLKPLAKAVADRDQIYGVIKSSALNHGGKTNGYSVPNPAAQANVIAQALKNSGVSPRAISYLEAHGTGTSLGDPIEITGLSKAFAESTSDKQFCAIGSVKSNIGHGESAAGIAGLTKILLQMKYGTLAPSLHSDTLNPHIDFANSPFTVQQELGEWKRPKLNLDGQEREYPRVAGVSSFGAGGSNAHLVVEEDVGPHQNHSAAPLRTPAVIVLSAKTEQQLKSQVSNLLAYIETQKFSDADLPDMAYTLQVGREAMEHRLALMANSLEEVTARLLLFAQGEGDIEGLYQGEIKRNKEAVAFFAADADRQQAIAAWMQKGKYAKLLEFWVKGGALDWNRLYRDKHPRRISLPTYPFAKEQYWAPVPDLLPDNAALRSAGTSVLHPLVQQNTSDLTEQRFTSRLTGEEFY